MSFLTVEKKISKRVFGASGTGDPFEPSNKFFQLLHFLLCKSAPEPHPDKIVQIASNRKVQNYAKRDSVKI